MKRGRTSWEGRTTVSRTRSRIASERRSRLGRFSRPVSLMPSLVGVDSFVLVIFIPIEKCLRAVVGAEAAAVGPEGTISTEETVAQPARLQLRRGHRDLAPATNPIQKFHSPSRSAITVLGRSDSELENTSGARVVPVDP